MATAIGAPVNPHLNCCIMDVSSENGKLSWGGRVAMLKDVPRQTTSS